MDNKIKGNLIIQYLWENRASDDFIQVIKKFISIIEKYNYDFTVPFTYYPNITFYKDHVHSSFKLWISVKQLGHFTFEYKDYNINDFECKFTHSFLKSPDKFYFLHEENRLEHMMIEIHKILEDYNKLKYPSS